MLPDGARLWFRPLIHLQFIVAVLIGEVESSPMSFPEVADSVQFGLHPQVHKVLEVEFIGRLSQHSWAEMRTLRFQFLLELLPLLPVVQQFFDDLLFAFVGDSRCQELVGFSGWMLFNR